MKTTDDKARFARVGTSAIAARDIPDSPLSRIDSSAKKGTKGHIVDYDAADGCFLVDFGNGAIVTDPSEIL